VSGDLGRQVAEAAEGARVLRGVVVVDPVTGRLAVSSSGRQIAVLWLAGPVPAPGDPVRVLEFAGERLVLPPVVAAPVASGSHPAMLTGVGAPPGPARVGTSRYPAVDSGYWSPASGWTGSARFGSRLLQGATEGANTGAWFYGPAPAELSGRTILAARVTVHRTAGYGDTGAAAAHLYAHTSTTRPAGNVTTTVAAGAASLPHGGSGTFPISVAAAQRVIAGGGLAITGGSHLVLEGVLERADSGLLEVDWRR
jgi:hypothetical protein